MPPSRCLYTIVHAPRERHDDILRRFVAPVARRCAGDPSLESLFLARYNKPDWQVRFRVLGDPAWIEGFVRPEIERSLLSLREDETAAGADFAEYEREYDRYGGKEGMRLAEQLFLHDTLACLDLIDLEGEGKLSRSRREWSLVYVERLFDLLRLDPERREEVYRYSYSWTLDHDYWSEDDLATLDRRYGEVREGIEDLLRGETSRDAALQHGGVEAAAIVARTMTSLAPIAEAIVEGVRSGEVAQEIGHLAWSYSHMHCNRLGIEAHAEAILRYFMHRFYEDRKTSTA